MTRHYHVLQSYVRAVALDLIERGNLRRKHGQSLDEVIRQEVEVVVTEVASDVRALGAELGVGAALTGVRLLELLVRQTTDTLVSSSVEALVGVFVNAAGVKSRR